MTSAIRPAGLPQLDERLFLTDGGIETTLIFREGELPLFAAFVLLEARRGQAAPRSYFAPPRRIARTHGVGFIASATWRASPEWGARLGYDGGEPGRDQPRAIAAADCAPRRDQNDDPFVISGCIGPSGDGYEPARG